MRLITSVTLCFVLFGAIPISLNAQATSDRLWPDSSRVQFRIRNAGFWVDGYFSGLELRGHFDPDTPESADVRASIPVSTIETGIDKRDEHLLEEKYFHEKAHPEMRLRSSSFTEQQDGFVMQALLTIKGVEREVTIPFSRSRKGAHWIVEGTFEIDRRDYGVGGNSWILSDEVEVTIWLQWPAA